jgi:hypothetical protein
VRGFFVARWSSPFGAQNSPLDCFAPAGRASPRQAHNLKV